MKKNIRSRGIFIINVMVSLLFGPLWEYLIYSCVVVLLLVLLLVLIFIIVVVVNRSSSSSSCSNPSSSSRGILG